MPLSYKVFYLLLALSRYSISAKIANKLQQHGVTLQFTKTDQVLAQKAMEKWELNWLAIRREMERGDPEDKETVHKAVARYSQWFRVFSLGGEARLHPYLCSGFQIPKGHIHSVARLRLGCHGMRVDRGHWDTHSHASDVNSLIYNLKEVWCQTLSTMSFLSATARPEPA
jgi:hypothetical protein